MSTNNYVYPHPINTYIIGQLGMSVDEFCDLHGFVRSTVASWMTRNKQVESLPCGFIYSLSLASSRPMESVYDELLKLQDQYLNHLKSNRQKKTKKNI